MANTSQLPTPGVHEPLSDATQKRPIGIRAVPLPSDQDSVVNDAYAGPRKLVRPTLPARALRDRSFGWRNESPMLMHQSAMMTAHAHHESSHAEGFYFQKQMQTQTLMVFVLEGGEQIEGYIEWYDRNSIKVRNHGRTLIYKSSIKYLYKSGEMEA
jgi:sRNA-binding regulator protein Hfq